MLVNEYFELVNGLIATHPFTQLSRINFDRRGSHEGFIRGEITFIDGSTLHLREYVDVETDIERLMYVYQYMSVSGELVFRYDNTGHHRELNLATFPHHKHDGNEGNVIASSRPSLAEVLLEIERFVELP